MATTQAEPESDLTDRLGVFLRRYYKDAVNELAEHYPNEQRSLAVDWRDLHQFAPDIADDYLTAPETIHDYLVEALRLYDVPIDIDLANAHVRVHELPDEFTYYPGRFSPTEEAGHYRAIQGEVSMSTDVYAKIEEAAFECKRCGTLTHVPQRSGEFQEPYECEGCERQGPFKINFDNSEFIDAQTLLVQTPPDVAGGEGDDLPVFVEDDLADTASIGDRITVTGTLHLEQQGNGQQKTAEFAPYLDGSHVGVEETDHTDLEIATEDRNRIQALADGAEGIPLDVAAKSLAPKIHGYETVKRMLILAMVGGSRVQYPTGDFDRGEFHMLLIGDPGTAKSKLISRVEEVGWRTVGVSGKGATEAGITATATQGGEFGEGEWTLSPGAFVKANEGVVCIDELDDMPSDVRAAMSEPMSKQTIHVSKAGINTRLSTRTAVVAAANPTSGRFDPYEDLVDQYGLEDNIESRFDLIYTFTDSPDPDDDDELAGHVLTGRDAAKRNERGLDVDDADQDVIDPVIDGDLLRKWIALARQQPDPVFASEAVKETMQDQFVDLRGVHGYSDDAPVPVTFRKLEGVVRIAEAAAKFEFSETIEERHARIATEAVGQSIQDYGTDEDGNLDADVQETGRSKSQRERMKQLGATIRELEGEYEDGVPRNAVIDEMTEDGQFDPDRLHSGMDKMLSDGVAIEPAHDHIRYLGRA